MYQTALQKSLLSKITYAIPIAQSKFQFKIQFHLTIGNTSIQELIYEKWYIENNIIPFLTTCQYVI